MLRQSQPDDVVCDAGQSRVWNELLRTLREAAGVSQAGWAAHLGYGRRTIQRWESGENPPGADASDAIIRMCQERGLLRTYRTGSLNGLTITDDLLRTMLAEARASRAHTKSALSMRRISQPSSLNVLVKLPRFEAPISNLPRQFTSFVGRESLLPQIQQRIQSEALVTLTGSGGVGKTRLAVEAAERLLERFPDGVWMIELDSVQDAVEVPRTFADVLRIGKPRGASFDTALAEGLNDRTALILVDSCEHVVAECARLIVTLLRACPNLRILATSRERLGVSGEVNVEVPPLSLSADESSDDNSGLTTSESTQLFVDRATAAKSGFRLTSRNASDVAEICARLDGFPLSIELAAAWTRVLSPAEIASHLEDRFRILSAHGPAPSPRHQSLERTIEWSYRLLSSAEQRLFDRLSVFEGSFSLADAERVCEWGEVDQVLQTLARLVEKSLVVATTRDDDRPTTFRLLDTLRDFADRRMANHSDAEEIRRRHAQWILAEALKVAGAIHGPDQGYWFGWIAKHDVDIGAAVGWALERATPDLALKIVTSLWWTLGASGRVVLLRSWLERGLDAFQPQSMSDQRLRAQALASLGTVNVLQGEIGNAVELLEHATELAESTGDDNVLLQALCGLALLKVGSGAPDAMEAAEGGLRLARKLDYHWYQQRLLEMQAQIAIRGKDSEAAITYLDEGISIARRTGDTWGLAQLLGNLGDATRSAGDHARARELYDESLALRATLGLPGIAPNVRHNLGYVALAEHQHSGVRERFVSALQDFQRLGDQRGVAECLVGLAGVEAVVGNSVKAATLFGAAEAELAALSAQIWPSNVADYDRLVALARARLEPDEFLSAWAAGRLFTLDRAIDLATNANAFHG